MNVLQSVIMGVVQGITEFFPIGSLGHMAVLKNLFGAGNSVTWFYVFMRIGIVAAIIAAYRKTILLLLIETKDMLLDLAFNFKSLLTGRRSDGDIVYRKIITNNSRKFQVLLLLSALPAILIGCFAGRLAHMGEGGFLVPGIGFLVNGIVLLVAGMLPSGEKMPKEVPLPTGIWLGIIQGLSVFPGLSRVGSILAASGICGLKKKFAIQYSFLLLIPTLLGECVYRLVFIGGETLSVSRFFIYLLGSLFAFAAGYMCLKQARRLLQRVRLNFFAYYCFLAGIIAVIINFVK
ncbi:MAG: undecaprenyl-diphosphate phosphatase [Lachnospiraceae bacterium]